MKFSRIRRIAPFLVILLLIPANTSVADQQSPAAPTDLRATSVSRDAIVLQWQDNSDNEDGFQIYEVSGTRWLNQYLGTVGPNVTTFTFAPSIIRGFSCDKPIEFMVSSYNSEHNTPGHLLEQHSNFLWVTVPCGGSTPPPTDSEVEVEFAPDTTTPWETACFNDPLRACFPVTLDLSNLIDNKWVLAARAAAQVWSDVGTQARFVERSVPADKRILVPIWENQRFTRERLAVGEVRVLIVSQIPVSGMEDDAAVGLPLRLKGKPGPIIAGIIFLRENPPGGFSWGWDGVPWPKKLDAQSVLAHELGHTLGLGHVPDNLNIMKSFGDEKDPTKTKVIDGPILYASGFTQRWPGYEDIDQLSKFYGAPSKTFNETGKIVSGPFWGAWLGGRSYDDSLYVNGLPITDAHGEISRTDGKVYKTQWFERARAEYHPENNSPYDLLFGLLGVEAAKSRQNEAPFRSVPRPSLGMATDQAESNILSRQSFNVASNFQSGLQWFPETQHTLGDSSEGGKAIAKFWTELGGIPQFGFPISQPFIERNKDNGQTYLVQYFERQRFEYHPENRGTRYEVLLGRLGAEQKDGSGFGPVSGELLHTGDKDQYLKKANVSIKDFTTEVKFYNPFDLKIGVWDVGIMYRINGGGSFEVVVTGYGQWTASETLNGKFNTLASGTLAIWDSSASGSNTFKVVAINNEGQLFVNGQGIANLDLSRHDEQGDIAILTGRYPGHWRPGAITRYEGFLVRPLKQP